MMPTPAALRAHPATGAGAFTNDFAGAMMAERSGAAAVAGVAVQQDDVRPLSDALGNYRILRTSPLTAVPEVC